MTLKFVTKTWRFVSTGRPKNNQKRKQTPEDKKRLEEDWKKYKKQFPNTGDRKKYSGWDYDEDDGER